MLKTHTKGVIGEDIACRYLVNKGFQVVDRNYRKIWGELDIIAVKDNVLNFFEVKSVMRKIGHGDLREGGGFRPEDNVHALKMRHIGRMVQTYMMEHEKEPDADFNFHVLCVFMDMERRVSRVRWIKNIIL